MADQQAKTTVNKTPVKKIQKKSNNFIKYIIVPILLFCFIIIGGISGILIGIIQASDSITPDDLVLRGFTTNIYDYKQKLVTPLHGDKNREMVDIKVTPKYLRQAIISIEDKRFYEHPGIDLKRLIGAVINYFKPSSSTYGASTITQQVVRNLTDQFEKSIKRKVQEQWKALELERHLTKDQILEIYMNIIFMGHNCYGVQSASKLYFNKDVSQLDLAEAAIIAGITNAPATYDPFTSKGRTNIKKRQEIILAEMLDSGNISQVEYDRAVSETLKYVDASKTNNLNTYVQSYFVDQVVIDVKKGLIESGYSEDLALKMIYNNGLKIYTTMDSDVQKAMDDAFQNLGNFVPVQGGSKPQSSMVVLDSKNGQVRALYGGAGPRLVSGFNRASSAKMARQPGSTFKPLAVYGPAIDQRRITAATVFDDVPIHLDGIKKKRYPENYDRTYRGLTIIREGIKYSLNVIAAKVWTMDDRFSEFAFPYLKKVDINRDTENYVSTALGGLNQGVNPLQLAAAYIPFVNQGAYYEPTTYTKVIDSKGKILLEKKVVPKMVYDPESAYIMTSILSEVTSSGGTAELYGKILNGNIPSAGKTGTTSDNKDKWFCGFSSYYLGCSWYGYDEPRALVPEEYERAQKLWNLVMNKIHAKLTPEKFVEPSGIVHKKICIYSGKTPTSLCERDPRGNAVRDEIFIKGTEPSDSDVCDVHVLAEVCADSKDGYGRKQLFGSSCTPSSKQQVVLIKRSKPYVPPVEGDPYPMDYKYEVSTRYCAVHSYADNHDELQPTSSGSPTPDSGSSNTQNNYNNPTSDIQGEKPLDIPEPGQQYQSQPITENTQTRPKTKTRSGEISNPSNGSQR